MHFSCIKYQISKLIFSNATILNKKVYFFQCQLEQKRTAGTEGSVPTLFWERKASLENDYRCGRDRCLGVSRCNKVTYCQAQVSFCKHCYQWPCWSLRQPAVEPQCWQLPLDSAGKGSLTRPHWLSHQMREGWGQCCSPLWRMSERVKSAPPVSPHPPLRKTQESSTTMRWLDYAEALGAVMVGGEVGLMYVAVLGLKQWKRHSLCACLSQNPCRHTDTGRILPVWWWWQAG